MSTSLDWGGSVIQGRFTEYLVLPLGELSSRELVLREVDVEE